MADLKGIYASGLRYEAMPSLKRSIEAKLLVKLIKKDPEGYII